MKRRIYILLFLSISFLLTSIVSVNAGTLPADSIRTKWVNGQKYVLHRVEPGETWTNLSKKYDSSVDVLMSVNKGIEFLKIGQIVNIPVGIKEIGELKASPESTTPNKSSITKNQSPQQTIQKTPVVHTVQSGETLFAIARNYNQPVETIKEYNNLKNDNIQIDQKLIVRYVTNESSQVIAKTESQKVLVTPAPPSEKTVSASTQPVNSEQPNTEKNNAESTAESAVITTTKESDTYFFDAPTKSITTLKKGGSGKSVVQVTETGVATWIVDAEKESNKYFGLHRSAPIGTIVKVTNRMNNQSVYVKIVGLLPDTGENEKVIIKLSQAVRTKLNALDPFFQVELTYGMMR